MYSVFAQLLQKYGVTSYKVSKDTGIAQSVLSAWKNGISTPKGDKLEILARYFNVSVEYLMTGKEKEFPEFEPEHLEMIMLYSKLNEEQKRTVMTFLRSLAPRN